MASDARAMGRRAAATARRASPGDWRSALARSGLLARGALYLILAVLVIQVARGEARPEEASREGAIERVAQQTAGRWLILALTIGLFALVAWRLVQAATGDPVEGDEPKDRMRFAGKAALYLVTAITSAVVLKENWSKNGGGTTAGGSEQGQKRATSAVLDWPAGWLIVIVAGLVLIAYAAYQLYRHGAKAKFIKRLAVGEMSQATRRAVEAFGRGGYSARSIVIATAGVFLVVAGATHDPEESKGFSGVLQELRDRSWGPVVLWIVAIGLVLFGLFNVAEARYRRAT